MVRHGRPRVEDLDFTVVQWRRSQRSAEGGNCVEVARAAGWTLVRDSKNPDAAKLVLTQAEWATFARSVRAGR